MYRLLTRARLRIVLEALEEALRSDKAEESMVVRHKLTIEHVLPQSWQTHWPINPSDDPEIYHRSIGLRDRLKHTVGNLTLVNGKLNPALSNGPWSEKQKGLAEHSTLFLNKQLLSDYSEAPWNEEQIRERGTKLADLATQIWPSKGAFIEKFNGP